MKKMNVFKVVRMKMGLVNEISIDEIRMALRISKNKTAAGPGGIPGEVWKVTKEE